jgi:transposase
MNAYSEDLRKKKIVEAVERGNAQDLGRSRLRCGYLLGQALRGELPRGSRSLAPKKRPGSKPKLDGSARKLLEADLGERPAATLAQRREFLRRARGVVEVGDSTVSRMLGRLGWTRKKGRWERQNATSG